MSVVKMGVLCSVGAVGSLASYKQSVPRAELYTILQVAKNRPAGSRCRVGVDCQYLIDGVRGSRFACATGNNGDLWDESFNVLDSKNISLELFKVKGHADCDEVLAGNIPIIDFIGNEAADAFAKRGAELWEIPHDLKREIHNIRGRAWRVGLRIAAVVAETAAAYKESGSVPKAMPVRRRSLADLRSELAGLGHDLEFEDKRGWCFRCGTTFVLYRIQCLSFISKGNCCAEIAPNGQTSKCFSINSLDSRLDVGPVRLESADQNPDVDLEPEDPFDIGDMDLDGNSVPPPPPLPADPSVLSRPNRFSEHRVFRGQLYLSVSSKPVHASHRMMFGAGIFYCSKCGCWGTVKARKLHQPCHLVPTLAGALALKKLEAGLAPTKATKLKQGCNVRPSLVIREGIIR